MIFSIETTKNRAQNTKWERKHTNLLNKHNFIWMRYKWLWRAKKKKYIKWTVVLKVYRSSLYYLAFSFQPFFFTIPQFYLLYTNEFLSFKRCSPLNGWFLLLLAFLCILCTFWILHVLCIYIKSGKQREIEKKRWKKKKSNKH